MRQCALFYSSLGKSAPIHSRNVRQYRSEISSLDGSEGHRNIVVVSSSMLR